MRLAVMANANLGATGVRAMSGPTGAAIAVSQRTRIELFQLTEAVQWPDATRTGGAEDEADVPWSAGAKRLWLEPWKPRVASPEGNTYSVQDGTGYSADAREETIYWPLTGVNSDGIAVDYTNLEVDDRVLCAFNRQSGRWESLDHVHGPEKRRYGKLDGALSAGGTATMSVWRDSTTKLWDGWDEDSGDNLTVTAPPLLSAGSIDASKWVSVQRRGSKWVLDGGEC